MTIAQRSTDTAVHGIAEFFGWRQRIETTVRVLFFGRGAARRVYEDAAIQASSDFQQIDSAAELARPPDNREAERAAPPRLQDAARANGHDGRAAPGDRGTPAEHAG
jgi:hypothetical protein